MSPPPFLMVDFSTVLSLDRLPPMSFPWTHKLSQHLYLNLHKILYSVGIVENTREYAKQFISFHVLYYQRTQQFYKSALKHQLYSHFNKARAATNRYCSCAKSAKTKRRP